MTIDAYPLSWPIAWPRTATPKRANFFTSLAAGRDQLLYQLRLLGATNIVISSNARLNKSGQIAAQQSKIDDPGVAVYFDLDGRSLCIPCDKWNTVADNVRAIGLTVTALRGLDRWGTGQMVDAAFAGFAALPAETGGESWWAALGVAPAANREEVLHAFRQWAKSNHPDAGGDPERFIWVKGQVEAALK